ncbi:YbaB/EbfC family nucleoid-associated protein [Lentzea sp. JNUCC 0626]|uniref:YbaB/EbfC family nucleoid-associated protein n=1 Tax=Lentzea sp. JNUCC 0626 TaxID=3367513 RepID=UPI003748619A
MNLFGGDPADVERGLDEWVAGFEQNAARYQELQREVDEVRISESSPNGAVTVTIDASGVLVDAKFTERVINTSPDELGRQLLIAVNQAKAKIAGRVRAVAGQVVGDEAGSRITGYYEQKFGAAAEQSPRASRPDDEGFGSVYR